MKKLKILKNYLFKETGYSNYRIFKSFYIKSDKKLSFINLVKDRIALIFRVLMMPLFLSFKKSNMHKSYIIDYKS